MFNPYDIAAAAGELVLNLADYLRRNLLPEVSETEPVGNPYTPPFEGGQCEVPYTLTFKSTNAAGGNLTTWTTGVNGKINAITPFVDEPLTGCGVRIETTSGTSILNGNCAFYRNFVLESIDRTDGLDDTCGNLPNPESPPPVSSDGLAQSPPPDIDDDENLVMGAPLVALPSIPALIALIGAAVRAATDALNAIKDIMDAIDVISDILDKIKKWMEDKDKNDDTKKSLFIHNYGSIRKDGFLRLYPSGEYSGFSPQYIDLQLLSIPIGYGKYFGNRSPNFYRFKSLGHISFVSASFGVLETHEIEFTRTSITVPKNAYGFYYHIGLEDVIRANVSMFYLKNVAME